MSFKGEPGRYYRMPIFFGPMSGPRQWPDGTVFDFSKTPKRKTFGVRFLGDADELNALLPDCFRIAGDPIVTIEVNYLTDIGWLAGRGYNFCDLKFDVIHTGASGETFGTLVLIRWENLADPILSGREELGHNKLYCEIPEPSTTTDRQFIQLSWQGTPFIDIVITDLGEAPVPVAAPGNQGTLSYKYIPATGNWGVADVEYATLTPPPREVTTISNQSGAGKAVIRSATWEDLPTLYHIVNRMGAFRNNGWLPAYYRETIGGSSAADTRRLA